METAVSSSSPLESLAQWRRTRLPGWMLASLALYVWGAALAGGLPAGVAQAALALLAAALLVAQFRLLDDLADLHGDRVQHPERALSQAASLAPFRIAHAALLAGSAVLLACMGDAAIRLGGFALLNLGLLGWYRLRKSPRRFINVCIVLGKYPVFAALLAAQPGPSPELLLSMTAVYLSFSVHEILHDRCLAARPEVPVLLAVEMIALCVTIGLMALALSGKSLAPVQWLLAGACAAGCPWIYVRHRALPGEVRYAIFAVAAPALFVFTLGSLL